MKKLIKKRLGKCYELAGSRMLSTGGQCELVHGTISTEGVPPNPHAWLEWDGGDSPLEDTWMVWEPISAQEFPKPVFYALFGAKEYYHYTFDTMSEWAMRTKHWGPWEGEGDYWKMGKKAIEPASR